MAVLLKNSFEGTDEADVTTANSNGDGSDPWNVIWSSAGTTVNTAVVKYDTAQVKRGTTSGRFDTNATGQITAVGWNGLTAPGGEDRFARFYLRRGSNPSAGLYLNSFERTGFGGLGSIVLQSNGILGVRNAAGTVTAMTTAIALAQWIRIEARIRPGSSTTEIECRLFNDPDATSPTDSVGITGQTGQASMNEIRFGQLIANNVGSWHMDDIAYGDTDWLGPYVAAAAAPGRSLGVTISPT